MKPITLDQILTRIGEFNERFPRYDMPPLAISKFCDVKDVTAQWPNAELPGVYFLFDGDQNLLYIGKASCNSALGYRLRAHFDKYGGAKHPAYAQVRFLATVPVPLDRAFEAPAIEEFLISKLNPPLCGIGRSAPIAMTDSV